MSTVRYFRKKKALMTDQSVLANGAEYDKI